VAAAERIDAAEASADAAVDAGMPADGAHGAGAPDAAAADLDSPADSATDAAVAADAAVATDAALVPADGAPDAPLVPDVSLMADVGSAPADADCTSCPPVVNAIDLDVEDMVFDSGHSRLYASIHGADAPTAEGLAIIDPVMRRLIGTMKVGPGARALAISEDHSTLWISVEREFAIRRLDLTTTPPTLGPLVPLPPDETLSSYKTVAGSMVVLPGTSRSVVVSMIELSHAFADVRVMDDGVARPMRPQTRADRFRAVPADQAVTGG
jgi:hypothetical protein